MQKTHSKAKILIAGFFMGLANLVPGVSGGTMILVMGLYDDFINSFSEITRFKFSRKNLTLIAALFGISFTTIFFMSGVIKFLMENFRSEMLALFIGFTLGGAPMMYKRIKPLKISEIFFVGLGIGIMAIVAFVLKPGALEINWKVLTIGGAIGSSAMILPGISGSYMLLIMGLYLPIISAIDNLKNAIKTLDITQAFIIIQKMIFPFSLGLVAGVILLSNILGFFLKKFPRLTEAFLFGFLLGSALGLYPFQTPSFSKLVKHSIQEENSDKYELRVKGYGWEPEKMPDLFENLKKLESEKLKINLLSSTLEAPLEADVENARNEKAVMIVYDKSIDQKIANLTTLEDRKHVTLISIPDTSFNFYRLITCIFLMVTGFAVTFKLGKFEE